MNRCRVYEINQRRFLVMLGVWILAMMIVMTVQNKIYAAETDLKTESTGTKQEEKPASGWKTVNGKKYYYQNGKKVKGWININAKEYYFSKKGELQKNTMIVNRAEKRCDYVDITGVRVIHPVITPAVAFVMKNSGIRQSSFQRLNACFQALCKYPYQRIYGDKPSAKRISSYAFYMLNNRQGNCYRYASAMAFIARVLGYDSRVAVGGVTSRAYGSLSPHGWCEVKIGNEWRIYDCSMQRAWKKKKLHNVKRSDYPFRLRCDHVYTMIFKNGKISWK